MLHYAPQVNPMRRWLAILTLLLGFGGLLIGLTQTAAAQQGPHAALLVLDGVIQPQSSKFLSRGIDAAEDEGAQFIIVQLDTPGGLFDSTRDMVGDILAAEIPVVVYVSPPGARAASAGTFITAAGHVAAMAPATNIGAASPVGGGGEDLPDTLRSKATQDAAAFLRTIADERGRNAEPLEETVLNAVAYTESEALELDIIDIVARDLDELLSQLDGRTVELRGRQVTLETGGLDIRRINNNAVEKFLGVLANPQIAFILLTIGGFLLIIELLNPGVFVPGAFGAIALALAFLGLGNLPVNWVAVGLIGLAMALFFAELQAPGLGIFGFLGGISFVLGAFLLFGGLSAPAIPTPSFRVNLWVIGAVSGVMGAMMVTLFWAILKSKKVSYSSNIGRLVGQTARTTTPLEPRGTVQVAGERWSAVSDSGDPIPEGEEVIVSEVEGLTLTVFRASTLTE